MRICFVAALALVSCSAPPTPDGGTTDSGVVTDGGAPLTNVCPNQTTEQVDGLTVTVCTELYATAPFLHLPADTVTRVYGGLKTSGADTVLATRTTELPITGGMAWAWVERESMNVRYGYFLYAARLNGTTVEEVVPAVRLDDRLFQQRLAGLTLEGLATARLDDGGTEVRFAFDRPDVGLRVKLDPSPGATAFDSLQGYPRAPLFGVIENAHRGVRASDGGCLPALDSLGIGNPLFSALDGGAQVMLLRHPGMHAAFDDVFTFDWPFGVSAANDMGGGLYIAPADFLRDTLPAPTEASVHPHGTPWGGPSAELRVVQGGGATCP